ncbi:MAG: tetratricopeptide repeat protein [Proteobacteria bacterium]|nr:tetratricopeptide repeat protein [Pseudomonadota bacterium]
MSKERVQRRLAAILAADAVGYSRLMGADEAGTRARFNAHLRDLIQPTIADHDGRIVKTTGDGLLVEFASVVDAVLCAVTIQAGMVDRNAAETEDRRLDFRIGVNLGDVIVEGGDIHGDGVNIAARLEGLAEPGGLCVSGKVVEEVRNKLDLEFEDRGEQTVKNIAEPVRAYHVRVDGMGEVRVPAPAEGSVPHRPSLAVLPFVNMSGDPEQEYFADGITEDLITEFSRFQELIVIARNSVFSYKGRAVKVQEVGRELGVRYVLEGSVRKAGERVRITAQLVEAATGHHLWAERYDRELEDVFAVQDEVTRQIVATLAGKLDATELRRARGAGERTENLEAYDLVLRGRERLSRFTLEDNLAARRLYEEAVALDPDYARAYAGLAWTYLIEARTTGLDEAYERALAHARKGVRINPASHSNYLTLGNVYLAGGKPDQAVEALERGIELNPNDSDGIAILAHALCLQGKSDEAIARINEAAQINPGFRQLQPALAGLAHFVARRYAEAVAAMEGLDELPPWFMPWFAAALAQLGREEEAKEIIARYLRTPLPWAFASHIRRFKHAEDRDHFAEALRNAGLPE